MHNGHRLYKSWEEINVKIHRKLEFPLLEFPTSFWIVLEVLKMYQKNEIPE
jgi:hypothetical protein